jgi:hypothetical protein
MYNKKLMIVVAAVTTIIIVSLVNLSKNNLLNIEYKPVKAGIRVIIATRCSAAFLYTEFLPLSHSFPLFYYYHRP